MAKKRKLNITEIEDDAKKILANFDEDHFIEDFLSLYDIPKTSITRAKKNVEKGNDFTIKNKLIYRKVEGDVVLAVDTIEQEIANQSSKPRYIMTTDYNDVAAIDTKTRETLNIPIQELPSNADFFLAWNGIEKAEYHGENPADRKAAERFAKLYDVIAKDNPDADEHAFNMFLIRTLFLLFAEDTGIIPKSSFTNVLKIRTDEDASNMNDVIADLFEILDIPESSRSGKESWLRDFPYVNGKLFGEKHIPLSFSKKSRQLLIEAGELLNWQDINPDILGAMIQSVASAEDRHVSGMHYTSVTNIMKVISPLFLDELTEEYDKLVNRYQVINQQNITKTTPTSKERAIINDLEALLDRLSKIKFLDPASGSGNFLIIAYKEIRRLEIKVLLLKQEVENKDLMPLSRIMLNQFSGIELDDFAHEVARLSLWIAEHQMNEEMVEKLPSANAVLLPLKDAGNIVQGNALQINWNTVVSHKKDDEVYIFGNPPYLGANRQKRNHKEDLKYVFRDEGIKTGELDYISAWFVIGAKYLSGTRAKLAFVTTNSIIQGKQVGILWPQIYSHNTEIIFGYSSFKWENSAKNNAGVSVVIIGLASVSDGEKYIFNDDKVKVVGNISPYITDNKNVVVKETRKVLNNLPKMVSGNRAVDGGGLIFTKEEYEKIIANYPEISCFFKQYVGAEEYINSQPRYTLWIDEKQYESLREHSVISRHVEMVRQARLSSDDKTTRELGMQPWRMREIRETNLKSIIVPNVSSESRDYVPMGFVGKEVIVSNAASVIYDAPTWLLALLESRMHMTWLRAIGGKLETRYRYSAGLVYNTFPIKNLSTQRKNEMSRVMLEILDLREYEGGTLAQLYNKDTMPESLRKKHGELDGIVDRAYRQKPFESDEERLSILLKLYQEMVEG